MKKFRKWNNLLSKFPQVTHKNRSTTIIEIKKKTETNQTKKQVKAMEAIRNQS